MRSNGAVHEPAIAAWEARVRQLAARNPPTATFDPALIDDAWIAALVALTLDADGPLKAVDHLRQIGIAFVVER
ncbi:hypothetical protein INQ10_23600, partial [Escherichia coli]|nr:hypothetical protein [Escherichia coli]